MAYRCRCGVMLDKPWMERAHRCVYSERRSFWKKFIIVECILISFVAVAYLLGI